MASAVGVSKKVKRGRMKDFIQNIPKAELHIHIEGSLEPETMFAIAQRNSVKLRFDSIEQVRKAYQFTDLQSFLDIYYEGMQVLLYEQDFYEMTWAYLEKASQDNVRHTEIFFDPQAHTERGVKFETVVNGIYRALKDAKEKLNICSKLIACFLRHLSEESAMETLQQILSAKDKIVAVGLDSSEVGHPPSKFKQVFEKARNEGLLTVAHAGEEGPPEYVWEAIDLLKVSRIDHGVRAIEDSLLVERLCRDHIPLTVCPLSNVKLCVFKTLQEHNLKKLLDLGLCVTINSDDPAYFGGYIGENFLATQKALNLSREDIVKIVKNSFQATFLNTQEKAALLQEVDEFVSKN